MKTLLIGDMHVKPSNLQESTKLMQFILNIANINKVDKLIFLGDLFDTHSVVRLEVSEFWHEWFWQLKSHSFQTIAIVGNHDMTGSYTNNYSALHPFKEMERNNFKIITSPMVYDNIGYLPYIHDDNIFVQEANKLAENGATVLMSHPNFIGAVYDNGTPINNGVDQTLLTATYKRLIGGHIHTPIELDRVWYIGTPRWLTASCANKEKGIWLVDFDEQNNIVNKEFVSTKKVCTPILSLVWKEGQPKPSIPKNAKVSMELIGSSTWVMEQKKELKGSVSVSSKVNDIKKSATRKSGKSLFEFLSKHYKTDKKDKLLNYMKGLDLLGN